MLTVIPSLCLCFCLSAESSEVLQSIFPSFKALGAVTNYLLHCLRYVHNNALYYKVHLRRFNLLLVIHMWNLSVHSDSWEVRSVICRKSDRDPVQLKLLRANTCAVLWVSMLFVAGSAFKKHQPKNTVGKIVFQFHCFDSVVWIFGGILKSEFVHNSVSGETVSVPHCVSVWWPYSVLAYTHLTLQGIKYFKWQALWGMGK